MATVAPGLSCTHLSELSVSCARSSTSAAARIVKEPISWSLSPHKVWRTCLNFASSLPLALGQPFCSRFRAWVSAVLCLETSASTFVRFFPSVPSMVMKPGPPY